MAVNTTARKQTFILDGVNKSLVFSFNALRSEPTDIKCRNITTSTDLIYTTDYTVTINTDGSGGVVNLVSAGIEDEKILVYRETSDKQESVYDDYNQFPADSVEKDFDRRTLKSQELGEAINRAVKADITSSLTGSALTLPSPTAGLALKWGASANTIINSKYDPDEQVDNASSYATIAQGHSDDADSYSTIATDKATEAGSYSTIASDKADESESYSNIALSHSEDASSYSTIASGKADEAESYSNIAIAKADEASSYATISQGHSADSESYSNIALGAKTDAETAETNAGSHATTALGAKDDASSYSTIASNKATEAGSHATIAQGHATDASNSADDASSYATIAQDAADIEVIDNLTSTSSTNALSANQGKALNDNKVEEAPEDGEQYARKDAGWVQVEGGDKTHLEQTPQELTVSSSTIAWNMNNGGNAFVTLPDDATVSVSTTNVVAGGTYRLEVTQAATASTLAFSSDFIFPGGVDPVLSSTNGAIDTLEFLARSNSTLKLVNAIFDSK